jgi:Arc/MetJ-type ribon-helix-helix transcriptional regulator
MKSRNFQEKEDDIHILNVRLPDEILDWLDSLVKSGVYDSRSEAVRDFIRNYVRSNRNG